MCWKIRKTVIVDLDKLEAYLESQCKGSEEDGQDKKETELVRSKFLKLNYSHIECVMDCMQSNTTKVRNIKKYLIAALFNAPSTMSGYYRAEVNHDLPQFARAK